jgi:hypothetical protein
VQAQLGFFVGYMGFAMAARFGVRLTAGFSGCGFVRGPVPRVLLAGDLSVVLSISPVCHCCFGGLRKGRSGVAGRLLRAVMIP